MFGREKQTITVCVLYLMACTLLFAEAQVDGIVETYPQWELPKAAKARLGKGDINAIQFSLDGTQLAVATDIGVWLYDAKTGKEKSLFGGMCGLLAFSPDGCFLVSGGADYFSNLGGSRWEKGVELWELATGQQVLFPDMPPAAAVLRFSEDGKTLISLSKSRDTISRLDIETGNQTVHKLGERLGYVHHEVYALTEDEIAIGMYNGDIELWDTTTGKRLSTLRENVAQIEFLGKVIPPPENNSVFVLEFSPDGTQLASASNDATIQLWDTTHNDKPITIRNHIGEPTALAFSPDGKILASGSDETLIQLWDTATGKSLTTFTRHISYIDALAFSPDGATLASASSDGTIRFWNIKTGDPLSTVITGHIASLRASTFLKDSSTIASIGYSGIITLWDLNTFQKTTLQTKMTLEMTRFRNWYPDLAFSPDGTKLVGFGSEIPAPELGRDYVLRLTDVSTGRELVSSAGGASDLTFSPDGKTVAGWRSEVVRLWDTETGKTLDVSLLDPNADREARHRPLIRTLEFSPDGRRLAGGTMGGDVQMWDTETGEALTSFFAEEPPVDHSYRDPIMDLAFSSDGSLLAVGSMKALRLLGNLKQIGFKEISYGAEVWGNTLLFSPDDTVLVIGLIQSGGVELWDLTTGKKLTTLDGHTNWVQTLAFSPDGKMLVSAGGDGTVLLWDWDEVLTTARETDKNAQLRNKEPRSETVLKFVEQTVENEANARHISTLERTYLKNKWKGALEQFKNDLASTPFGGRERDVFAQIVQMGKNIKDKAGYVDMLHQLMDAIPDNLSVQFNTHFVLAGFYRDNRMSEKAEAHIQKTGFITEDKWLILGPFDNTGGIGYNTAYIPENATQIERTKKYESIVEQIHWQKSEDDTLNGYISLGDDVDWGVAYAFATVISPDEREGQIRFDSDDQGKVWLNGIQIFKHTKAFSAEIDKYIIPVILKPGKNNILVKVCEEQQGWGFYLRITDTDGKPFRDLKVDSPEAN
ncbi:hypothetical protein J5I95_04090 [Candidatus Poribacteria bacterium]|nr:hypothetical protein [Candidatus Poribacteria bacterium]